MRLARRAGLMALVAALSLSTVACSAQGRVGEDGIEAEVEGDNGGGGGEGGEGGDR